MLLRGLVSASNGMQALIEKNDSTANNVANVNTVGFKKENIIFKNIYDANVVRKTGQGASEDVENLGELSVGSQVQKVTHDFSQGALSKTGSPFDLAVQGDGFFKVQSTDGDISYTRNGSFALNSASFLVTKDGDYVLDDQNQRVKISTNDLKLHSYKDIMIGERGQIQINNEKNQVMMQKVGVYDFRNKEDMVCVGGSKFRPTDATTNPEVKSEKFTIEQGALEMSNANVVNEMISTINTSRNYEALSKLVKASSDTLSAAIRVGRVG